MTSFGFDFPERDVPPSSEELAAAWRHYIEPRIEAFGPKRCMHNDGIARLQTRGRDSYDGYEPGVRIGTNAAERHAGMYQSIPLPALVTSFGCFQTGPAITQHQGTSSP
jgi:hypothetical protein